MYFNRLAPVIRLVEAETIVPDNISDISSARDPAELMLGILSLIFTPFRYGLEFTTFRVHTEMEELL